MKKFLIILMSLLVGTQSFAAGWHGGPSYHGGYHNGPIVNNYYGSPGGQWRHTSHNGQLAWWFVVGSAFYLTEQAYLNDTRRVYYDQPVVVTPQPVYVQPPVTTYVSPTYRTSYGWYCESTGLFSTSRFDTCPTPWVSRPY